MPEPAREARSLPKPARRADPAPAFGGRIRDLRRKAAMTLQALADRAGISVGFLSLVERDKATPSLGTLASLADALGVDVEFFITSPKPADSLSRAEGRARFSLPGSVLGYERLTTALPGGVLSTLIVHVPEGYRSEVTAHPGEEIILVLEGRLRQTLGDAVFTLDVGDSLHFMGETPHSFANIGAGSLRLLWTGTTPRLIGRRMENP
ncbi:MAG: XRE family transcriptional regulator [Paracoccus sp. (in: a-proteobacteria)]|nr:XRE family transcriptional regulator [Paracoccus sp. (in: a-proteobacteria)]